MLKLLSRSVRGEHAALLPAIEKIMGLARANGSISTEELAQIIGESASTEASRKAISRLAVTKLRAEGIRITLAKIESEKKLEARKESPNAENILTGLLARLDDRSREIMTLRFGLFNRDPHTLESIGKKYDITRERVRQIERASTRRIRELAARLREDAFFLRASTLIREGGEILAESSFLAMAEKEGMGRQRDIQLLISLSPLTQKTNACDYFEAHLSNDPRLGEAVREATMRMYKSMRSTELISESVLCDRLAEEMKAGYPHPVSRKTLMNGASIFIRLQRNILGQWGLACNSTMEVSNSGDRALIILKQSGEPLHFTEIAKKISALFQKEEGTDNCHNQLVKDPRFILVGRGTYGLAEWGTFSDAAKETAGEVVRRILRKEGPLRKEQVISKVLAERRVKIPTIVIELNKFRRNARNQYFE